MSNPKTILLTGATAGIGLEAARLLASKGHRLLLHGRNAKKLQAVQEALPGTHTYQADLSRWSDIDSLADALRRDERQIDVLIHNAGVYRTTAPRTDDGLDLRFMVNTFAPYRLTRLLAPLLPPTARIVSLSSAAQAPVELAALRGEHSLPDGAAYAQSKLALTMWSRQAGLATEGPLYVALNPGSLLGTNMVKEAFGIEGGDVQIGAKIIVQAALDDSFSRAHGQYFDNDAGRFAEPHPDALDPAKCRTVVEAIAAIDTQKGERTKGDD